MISIWDAVKPDQHQQFSPVVNSSSAVCLVLHNPAAAAADAVDWLIDFFCVLILM